MELYRTKTTLALGHSCLARIFVFETIFGKLYYLMTIFSVESQHIWFLNVMKTPKYIDLWIFGLWVRAVVCVRREMKESQKLFHGLFPNKLTQIRIRVNQNSLSSSLKSLCYISSYGKGTRNQISATQIETLSRRMLHETSGKN